MSSTPNFATTPRCAVAQATAANTARDGTGTIATVFTAGASGSRVDSVTVTATGNTTAGMIRLFIHDGSNARLFSEIDVTAVTVGATTKAFTATVVYRLSQAIILPDGYSLRASTHNAETFNLVAFGGDF